MTSQPHFLSDLGFAARYFEKLPADDISRHFADGERFRSNLTNRLKLFFSIDSTLGELNKFYPYQPLVKRTNEVYQEKKSSAQKTALTFSGISIFLVYQLAKQNTVLPILSQFGKFFKTHRLFRQYFWLAVLPYTLATAYTNNFFLNQTERLWATHASRLNLGINQDPEDSQYPIQLMEESQVYKWHQPFTHKFDLPQKWRNQVPIYLAPDYSNIEEWNSVPLVEPTQDEEGEASEESEQ